MKQSLIDAIGGVAAMERVHTKFYDKVYAHAWLGPFFEGYSQKLIELRQTQFMARKMGAKQMYPVKDLDVVHHRMYITEELLLVREVLLRETIEEEGISSNLVARWLKIDRAFWSRVKKGTLDEFQQSDLKGELPLIIEKPKD